jgi:MFS transporter, putative metabolite:H+ symporter
MSARIGEHGAAIEAAKINIPGRLERLPMTSYQKRMFTIVATAWLADQVDVALLVFLRVAMPMQKSQAGRSASPRHGLPRTWSGSASP